MLVLGVSDHVIGLLELPWHLLEHPASPAATACLTDWQVMFMLLELVPCSHRCRLGDVCRNGKGSMETSFLSAY